MTAELSWQLAATSLLTCIVGIPVTLMVAGSKPDPGWAETVGCVLILGVPVSFVWLLLSAIWLPWHQAIDVWLP